MATPQSTDRRPPRAERGVIHRVDIRSTAEVTALLFGGLLLVVFMALLLPWLLAEATTEAVEGLMQRIGFRNFNADTLGDWVLVLVVITGFTAMLVGFVVVEVAAYNRLVQHTGWALPMPRRRRELVTAPTDAQVRPPRALPPTPARRAASKKAAPRQAPSRFALMTFDQLYAAAQRQRIPGRSSMSKAELRRALERRTARR
jgi:hypothetical protein